MLSDTILGSLLTFSLLAFAEGLFYFEKEGFLKIMQYNEYRKI